MEAVLNGLTDQGLPVKLDMAQKQSLSRFLNSPASGIYSSEFIQAMQKYYVETREQQSKQKGMNIKLPDWGTQVTKGQQAGEQISAL